MISGHCLPEFLGILILLDHDTSLSLILNFVIVLVDTKHIHHAIAIHVIIIDFDCVFIIIAD